MAVTLRHTALRCAAARGTAPSESRRRRRQRFAQRTDTFPPAGLASGVQNSAPVCPRQAQINSGKRKSTRASTNQRGQARRSATVTRREICEIFFILPNCPYVYCHPSTNGERDQQYHIEARPALVLQVCGCRYTTVFWTSPVRWTNRFFFSFLTSPSVAILQPFSSRIRRAAADFF